MKEGMKIYRATFTRDGKRWLVQVPEVPGCHTQALTVEQGLRRISEALALYGDGKFEVMAVTSSM
jgi:predicted RNase H-like HicB family nuclease